MGGRSFILVGVVVAIAVAIGLSFVIFGGSSDSSTSSGGKGSGSGSSEVTSGSTISDESLLEPADGGNSTGSTSSNDPDSDPDTQVAALTMLAIGDWGATVDKPGSCCNKYRKTPKDSLEYMIDYWAQINVAEILSQSAGSVQPKPSAIIGHGDNIYWNGVGLKDIDYRMETTFESVYNQPSMEGIPWVNVAGNHDLGGSDYICGDADYQFRKCKSVDDLLLHLKAKFDKQATYKSPNGDRWKMSDHYFKESFEADGVSVDVYNVDTNYADSHGVRQICCQCYGVVKDKTDNEADAKAMGSGCEDAKRGEELCIDGDVDQYDACEKQIKEWWDDSVKQIQADLKESKATWKVINSHYSPHFHMSEDKMKVWYSIAKEGGVQVFMNGHTHGINHDYGKWGTHFFENGAGGGIQSETSGLPPDNAKPFVENIWVAAGNPYGFFELHFSKDWLKMQFVTFDDAWKFSLKAEEVVQGGSKKDHCYHVPVTMSKGRECGSSPGTVLAAV